MLMAFSWEEEKQVISWVLSPSLKGRIISQLERAADKERVGLPHSFHPPPTYHEHISQQEGDPVEFASAPVPPQERYDSCKDPAETS